MTITEAVGDLDLASVRQLFDSYAASLPFSLDYQGFAAELAALPGPYAPPDGCLLLARSGPLAVGIVALRRLAPGVAEMKRLFVVPSARQGGFGRKLAERAIAEARERGYVTLRLDTHRPTMAPAIALYTRLGFAEIPPYGANPGGEIAFFEKRL